VELELCTVEDVYGVVPSSVLMRPALQVSAVDTTANTLTVNGHGLAADHPFDLLLQSGGSAANPLSANTTYYAEPVSDTALRVRASSGGAAIDLTMAGSGMMIRRSSRPGIVQRIREYSRWVFDRLPAHAVLEQDENGRYPDAVRGMVAVLAAEASLEDSGQTSETVTRRADRVRRDAELTLGGLPLRDHRATELADLATGGSPDDGRYGEEDGVIP
jgi:hypothetical protein